MTTILALSNMHPLTEHASYRHLTIAPNKRFRTLIPVNSAGVPGPASLRNNPRDSSRLVLDIVSIASIYRNYRISIKLS